MASPLIFVQANIRTTKTLTENITLNPTFTIGAHTFQGTQVRFAKGWPANTLQVSIGHISADDIHQGDTIIVDLGNGQSCSGTVNNIQGQNNQINCTI